ncbi:hypothetical protein AB6D92_11245 [Vibrio splendidus]
MTILRSKWNLLNIKVSISELVEQLVVSSFKDDAPYGFEVITFDNSQLVARYHEEYEHIDSYFDPLGKEEIVRSVRYKFVNVRFRFLGDGKYLVQLENLPRTSISLFMNLKIALETDISVSDVKFDIESLLETISTNEDVRQFKVKQASFSSIYLNEKSRAKLEITSTKNALVEFRNSFDYKKYAIDKVKCDFRLNGESLYLELRRSGVISHSKSLVDLLTLVIRNNLTKDKS